MMNMNRCLHRHRGEMMHEHDVRGYRQDVKDMLLRMWRRMVKYRIYEQEIMRRYEEPYHTRCPIHYAIGQEEMPALVEETRRDGDYMFAHHRNHGYFLAWTDSLEDLLAELMGKENAPNRGRAGSQEISVPPSRFHSGAILAGMIGIAVGTALSIKMRGGDEMVYCAFGDGAADEGVFWEAMNYVALKKLRTVFICENNGYATFSPQHERQFLNIHARVGQLMPTWYSGAAVGLGYPMFPALKGVIDQTRESNQPLFIEHYTYRQCGHVGAHDDDTSNDYRPEWERELWKKNDPVGKLECSLSEASILSSKQTLDTYQEYTETFAEIWDRVVGYAHAAPIAFESSAIDMSLRDCAIPASIESSEEVIYNEAILRPY